MGADSKLIGHPYREPFRLNDATVTLYPAGHVLGSAQVLIEYGGHRLVISGDYKRDDDPSCDPFEVVERDTFINAQRRICPIWV